MEVRASSIKKYVDALSASGSTFLSVNTATGGSDRIVYSPRAACENGCGQKN
jgi:hypothetical protein